MKQKMSKEWFLEKVAFEKDALITAGNKVLTSNLILQESMENDQSDTELNHAFSKLINLSRREMGLSIELLSKKAEIDEEEILHIERDEHYQPEPRSVFQLANFFKLEVESLQELAGNIHAKNAGVYEESIRFAAKSASVEKLSSEEHLALEKFVTYLSRNSKV